MPTTTQVVELEGVKVDEPATADVPVSNGAPVALQRSASTVYVSKMKNGEQAGTASNSCSLACIVFLIIFLVNGGLEARCDRPLPMWLLINVIVGSVACVSSAVISWFIEKHASVPLTENEQLEFGPKGPKRKPTKLGQMCLMVLCVAPIVTFVLYVQGNMMLWSTFPSANATLAEPPADGGTLADGIGCDPGMPRGTQTLVLLRASSDSRRRCSHPVCATDLYWALRGYMIFSFVMLGLFVPICCIACIAICIGSARRT